MAHEGNATATISGGTIKDNTATQKGGGIYANKGTITVTGGTLIILGYGRVSTGGSVKSYQLSLNSAGSHTVTIGGVSYTFANAYSYSYTYCYSDTAVSGS